MIEKIKELPKSYIIASFITVLLLAVSVLNPSTFPQSIEYLNDLLFQIFGKFYLWFVYIALILFVVIGISPLGSIRIGGKKAKPDYNMFSWFSMLFCAGMGVAIFYWGGAEPLMHYMNPFLDGPRTDIQNEIDAFKIVFFHWCLHPWAIYGLTTLLICFFSMNLTKGIHFSSFFSSGKNEPTLFKRILKSFLNNLVTLAILFGIVASFGFGVVQFEGGLTTLFNIQPSAMIKIGIIIFITICYMISTLRGLDKGIKVLSNFSMVISFILLAFIGIAVPFENYILPLVKSLPQYITDINNLSIADMPYKDENFANIWTIKYWAWWTAWAPFVGMFVALISKGRTIRELVYAMLLVPSIYTIIAAVFMGEAALYLQHTQHFVGDTFGHSQVGALLYQICNGLYHSPYLSWLALVMVGIFFINSADSATYTLAVVSRKPKKSVKITDEEVSIKEPPVYLQICWGVTFSILAGLFLLVGGINIIEKTMLITVLPFTFILCAAFIKMIFDMVVYYKKYYLKDEKQKYIKMIESLKNLISEEKESKKL